MIFIPNNKYFSAVTSNYAWRTLIIMVTMLLAIECVSAQTTTTMRNPILVPPLTSIPMVFRGLATPTSSTWLRLTLFAPANVRIVVSGHHYNVDLRLILDANLDQQYNALSYELMAVRRRPHVVWEELEMTLGAGFWYVQAFWGWGNPTNGTNLSTPFNVTISGMPVLGDTVTARVHRLVNEQRIIYQLEPCLWDDRIARAAALHAQDMAMNDYFGHISLNGYTPIDRIRLQKFYNGWAENIGGGLTSAEQMTTGWMNSRGHRENLLDPTLRYVGSGYFRINPDPGLVGLSSYWVMDYGLRPPGCGNGALDVGEKCDDQNLIDGDGCSSNCTIEAGWVCWKTDGGPTPCKRCGDGIVQRGEECDDGNRNNGDGCNSQCAIELSRGVRCNLAQPSVCWIDPTALNYLRTKEMADSSAPASDQQPSDGAIEWNEEPDTFEYIYLNAVDMNSPKADGTSSPEPAQPPTEPSIPYPPMDGYGILGGATLTSGWRGVGDPSQIPFPPIAEETAPKDDPINREDGVPVTPVPLPLPSPSSTTPEYTNGVIGAASSIIVTWVVTSVLLCIAALL